MAEPAARRFSLADVMILVAAAAVAMVLSRLLNADTGPVRILPSTFVTAWAVQASPFLIVAPFALLAVRFRRPRPPLRRVFRQPGTVACLAVVFSWVMSSLPLLLKVFLLTALRPSSPRYGVQIYLHSTLYMGSTVVLAWTVLALARAWRPEASWIDRAGRRLGVTFIVVWVVVSLVS